MMHRTIWHHQEWFQRLPRPLSMPRSHRDGDQPYWYTHACMQSVWFTSCHSSGRCNVRNQREVTVHNILLHRSKHRNVLMIVQIVFYFSLSGEYVTASPSHPRSRTVATQFKVLDMTHGLYSLKM